MDYFVLCHICAILGVKQPEIHTTKQNQIKAGNLREARRYGAI